MDTANDASHKNVWSHINKEKFYENIVFKFCQITDSQSAFKFGLWRILIIENNKAHMSPVSSVGRALDF